MPISQLETPLSPAKSHVPDPDSAFFTNPVDIFVHSGANMCFGILLLMMSMVPPAFSRLLYVIGFKGDRARGVRMMWQSTKFDNINGGVAGLMLLSYYNGIVAFADILPSDADVAALAGPAEIVGYQRDRCLDLLAKMRARYPASSLWRLEEARSLGNDRHLADAMALLRAGGASRIRQVNALHAFELALDALCCGDWPLTRDSFLRCQELNDWLHALYLYDAGIAEIEMYRDAFHRAASLAGADAGSDADAEHRAALAAAAKHKSAAHDFLHRAPTVAGRKKFMARQMPFEVFTLRKIAQWEERAAALGLDLADAVGVSPAQEMVYLWNGSKRMAPDQLERALRCLAWDRCTAGPDAVDTMRAAPVESALKGLCEAALLRSLGRFTDARKVLDEDVLTHDR